MPQTDEQYVRHCLNGQPEAFRHLVIRHQTPLVRYLSGRMSNEEEAIEAAQETLVRAYFALRKLKKPEAFRSWLLGIAERVAKESYRQKQRRRQVALADREAPADDDRRPEPELRRAVAGLPDVYRQVVLLRYYSGLSCADISRDLNVPIGTVTKRLSRAYALLREFLRKPHELENLEGSP